MTEHNSVVFIITHTIKNGSEKKYEDWLKEILDKVSKSKGYLGRDIFRPSQGKNKYTSIVRFDNHDNLENWSKSEHRNEMIDKIKEILVDGDINEIKTGIDFWFTPESIKAPKRWKQYTITLLGIYPLSQIVPYILKPLFNSVEILSNPLIKGFIISASIVFLMTFLIMPNLTKLTKKWLYNE